MIAAIENVYTYCKKWKICDEIWWHRYGRKYLVTGITVILRGIKYKFRKRNESKVLACDSNAFYLKVLKINELLLWELDVNVKVYELINLKWKLGVYIFLLLLTITQFNLFDFVSWKLVKLLS